MAPLNNSICQAVLIRPTFTRIAFILIVGVVSYVSVTLVWFSSQGSKRFQRNSLVLEILPPTLRYYDKIPVIDRKPPIAATDDLCYRDELHTTKPTALLHETLTWQPVTQPNGSSELSRDYVFSAFYDSRWSPAVVLIIGLAKDYKSRTDDVSHKLLCRLWYSCRDEPVTVRANFRYVPETHGRTYATAFYACPVEYRCRNSREKIPYAVSLITGCRQVANNLLKVFDTAAVVPGSFRGPPGVNGTKRPVRHTVCLSVLHSNYYDYRRLIEVFELNRLLGAERLVIYNLSSSADVQTVLDSYARDGLVEVIPWSTLPLKSAVELPAVKMTQTQIEVHYFAQVAALNDCLYRNMPYSTFLLMTDIDEIVVPRDVTSGNGWTALLESVTRAWSADKKNAEKFPGVYMARNVFFRPRDQNHSSVGLDQWLVEQLTADNLDLVNANRREDYVYPYDVRSKYFVWSKTALMLGIHFPYETVDASVRTVYMTENAVLLHHYRVQSVSDKKPPPNVTEDRLIEGLASELLQEVTRRRKIISNASLSVEDSCSSTLSG